MHPLKSISATLVVVAGRACSGIAVASFELITSDGIQSGAPPLMGLAAWASTLKGTLPISGVEYVNPEDEYKATLGLLAGTTKV